MRRRQHRKLRCGPWVSGVLAIVLVSTLILISCVAPFDEMSGKITDMWEEKDGDFMLEIDDSITKGVDSLEYHNLRVGDVYVWEEESEEVKAIGYVMVPVICFLVICVVVWGDD